MKKGKFKKFLAGAAMGICALAMPFGIVGCTPEKDINVRFQDDYFQWQYEGDTNWNNLLTIDEIKEKLGEGYKGETGATGPQGIPGTDGKEVEFQKNNTHIQWRYKTIDNSDAWKDLVALSEIKGEDGKTPYIGENGNWWINEEDTGVIAEGVNGSPKCSHSG